ncbi:MotA/TolQ/ExbB proton channel family protein [Zavarzinia sp.]|uniref:MotA/TolQ/ExbB proton channel family protein n=1 Tax=Zavarzinia sp. TaxID=2027920 RepID=UPI0035699B71
MEPTAAVDALAAPVEAAAPAAEVTITGLFLHADPVVQGVMILLLLASVITWSIVVDRLARLRRLDREVAALEAKVAARKPGLDGLAGLARATVEAGLFEWHELAGEGRDERRLRAEQAMRLSATEGLRRLEVGLPFLATIGSAGPFIGLFGTVWGILHSFTAIANSQDTSLAVVAPGIAEALFATAIGLVAAIPAVIWYNAFSTRLGRLGARLSTAVARVTALLGRGEVSLRRAAE